MEALGPKIRKQRRRLGLTLDELAGRTSISKPYLSLIETGRVTNPPSDEKLRRLEQSLGFNPSELLTQAHLQRTPRDVRAVLQKLMAAGEGTKGRRDEATKGTSIASAPSSLRPSVPLSLPIDLDDAYMAGVLQELVDKKAGNIEQIASNAVPVINKVSAGYPRDFS